MYVARTVGTVGSTPIICCEEVRTKAKVFCLSCVRLTVTSLYGQTLCSTSRFLPSVQLGLLLFLSLAPPRRCSAQKMPYYVLDGATQQTPFFPPLLGFYYGGP